MIREVPNSLLDISDEGRGDTFQTDEREERLLQKTLEFMRFRLHEGYFFGVYKALGNLVSILEEKHPQVAAKYSEVLKRFISNETEVLSKVLILGKIDILKPATKRERQIFDWLLKPHELGDGEKEIILSYFLPPD